MLVEVILLLVLLTCCCSKKYIRPSSPTRATGAMVQLEQASLQLDGAAGAGVSAAGFRTSANQHVPSSAAGHPGSAHEQSVAQPVQQPEASEAEATLQLRLAVSAGDQARVAAELAKGARVDAADAGGQTALYKAANLGKPAIVKLLVDGGANVNQIIQKVRRFAQSYCMHLH